MGRGQAGWLAWKWRVHSRLVLRVGAGLAGTLLFAGILLMALAAWRDHAMPGFMIAIAVIGLVGTLLAIINGVLNIRSGRFPSRRPRAALIEPRLTHSDSFVDRGPETDSLVRAIESHSVTNLHGRKGSGKSHFLAFVSDVANGHRKPGANRSALRRLTDYHVLYFDLSDAMGFDDIVKRLFLANFPDQTASWEQLTHIVAASFGQRPVILILDNVNSEGISTSLGRAIYYYLAHRPSDRVVLGSIRPIGFLNLDVHGLPFDGFNQEAITEFASASNVQLDSEQLNALRETSDGLPIFLRLLFAHWDRGARIPPGTADGIRVLLREAIAPRLSEDAGRLLVGIALLSILNAEVIGDDLRRLPISGLEKALEELRAYSLINVRHRATTRSVKLHDLVRDAVIEVLHAAVGPMARDLAVAAEKRGADREASLLWLFAAPNGLDAEATRERVIQAIVVAVSAKDYPFLSSVALIAATRAEVKKIGLAHERLADTLIFAEASAFTGIGKYEEALISLEGLSAATARKLQAADGEFSPVDFELAYLQANLLHLQNRYDEALDAFGALRRVTEHPNFLSHAARLEFAIGHSLRHQARDLEGAMRHFRSAEAMAIEAGDLPTELSSVTGRIGTQVYLDQLPDGVEDELIAFESRVADDTKHNNYLPKIWKSLSQVCFRDRRTSLAFEHINRAIRGALEFNDRLLFNYRFERGEFSRLTGNHDDALSDYCYVLESGRSNGDRNLIANALLGIVETEISSGRLAFHRSKADLRGSILQARAIAMDADILATQQQAERTLGRLGGRHTQEARLVLF
jgi:tetratricopeptide (TPR) repeat protein